MTRSASRSPAFCLTGPLPRPRGRERVALEAASRSGQPGVDECAPTRQNRNIPCRRRRWRRPRSAPSWPASMSLTLRRRDLETARAASASRIEHHVQLCTAAVRRVAGPALRLCSQAGMLVASIRRIASREALAQARVSLGEQHRRTARQNTSAEPLPVGVGQRGALGRRRTKMIEARLLARHASPPPRAGSTAPDNCAWMRAISWLLLLSLRTRRSELHARPQARRSGTREGTAAGRAAAYCDGAWC